MKGKMFFLAISLLVMSIYLGQIAFPQGSPLQEWDSERDPTSGSVSVTHPTGGDYTFATYVEYNLDSVGGGDYDYRTYHWAKATGDENAQFTREFQHGDLNGPNIVTVDTPSIPQSGVWEDDDTLGPTTVSSGQDFNPYTRLTHPNGGQATGNGDGDSKGTVKADLNEPSWW